MFALKKKKIKLLALVLAVMIPVTSLSGCSRALIRRMLLSRKNVSQEESYSQETRFEPSQPEAERTTAEKTTEEIRDEVLGETGSESAGLEQEDVKVPASEPSRSTVRERLERLEEKEKAAQETGSESAAPEQEDVKVPASEPSRSTVRERLEKLEEEKKAAQESGGTPQSGKNSKTSVSSGSGESSKAPSSSGSGESSKAPDSTKSSSKSSKSPAANSSSASSESKTEEKLRVGSGLEDIAQLIGMKAGVEKRRRDCVVDVDEGENPYDVIWDYGELYDAFVQEVDWNLLFDGDYYIRNFPGLAHLYHKDKALLLQHFQTVGIHEGRQGCEGFNVAAYQKNCDAKIREAFGDSYECYYFYYAMNQKTQKGIVTTGSEKKQLTTKLTYMQQAELDRINQYRAEVGVAPLEYDAELSALACYRAYVDALEDWDAHDWIEAAENQDEINGMIEMIRADLWGENTVHGYPRTKEYALSQGWSTAWYINYRYSQDHYDAMVAKKYHYVGSANCYISDYEKNNSSHPNAGAVYVHYDVFVPNLITPTNR